MRYKRPSTISIGIDLDKSALTQFAAAIAKNDDASASPNLTIAAPITAVSPSLTMLANIVKDGEHRDKITLIHGDALTFLSHYEFDGSEFIYVDPPYLISTRRNKRPIYKHEYTDQDHVNLLQCLKKLPCHIMISGYGSQLYADLLPGWHTHTFQTMTRGGKTAIEWLWMNYPPPLQLHDYTYLGNTFRERERIGRKAKRWVSRFNNLPQLERQFILSALATSGVI